MVTRTYEVFIKDHSLLIFKPSPNWYYREFIETSRENLYVLCRAKKALQNIILSTKCTFYSLFQTEHEKCLLSQVIHRQKQSSQENGYLQGYFLVWELHLSSRWGTYSRHYCTILGRHWERSEEDKGTAAKDFFTRHPNGRFYRLFCFIRISTSGRRGVTKKPNPR